MSMHNTQETEYLTVREAAALIGVSPGTLRKNANKRKVRHFRDSLNGRLYFLPEDLPKGLVEVLPKRGSE